MLMSVLLLPACQSMQTVAETNANHVSNNIQRDSIYLHDSIFVHIRADTVYLEKWHTRWRDRQDRHYHLDGNQDRNGRETLCTLVLQVLCSLRYPVCTVLACQTGTIH